MCAVAGPVEIDTLTGLAHLAPVLAAWHHDEWGHLYDPTVWNREVAGREFVAMAQPESADRTWVAFDGAGRDAGSLLGSVSLVATDDLTGFEHLTPWLASMYVTPEARGRRVAARLTAALLAGARADGHEVVHLFTAGQEAFWAERGWSVVASVDTEGHPATVMARSTHRRAARRAVSSRWCADPDHGGAYSYLRRGATPAVRDRLATRIVDGLWFAGEATWAAHPATMHGAWFSGERAASQVLAAPDAGTVAVIGAGLSGLVTAQRLHEAGRQVMVFESKPIPGGRIVSDRSTGTPLPLGGAWLHGDLGHPMAGLVTAVRDDWERPAFYAAGVGRMSDEDVAEVTAIYESVHAAFARAEPTASVADVLDAALGAGDARPLVREAVRSWVSAECESLFAAPMDDLAANGGFEPFELPGDDHLITSDVGEVAVQLAAGLDVRYERRVTEIRREGAHWSVDGTAVDAVVVTVPIGALAAGRISFHPPLPDDVVHAIASIGVGPVAKVFATFDRPWWPDDRPIRLVGASTFGTIVDVSAMAGRPTLLGFAVGEAARRVEALSEHELCRLFDHELAVVGLRDDVMTGSR